jgi:hypothetical protein
VNVVFFKKKTKNPYPTSCAMCTIVLLAIIHTDLCGPMSILLFGGPLYFLLFIGDFLMFIFTYFL